MKPGSGGAEERLQKVRVRYETTDVAYVSQFMMNRSAEDIVINFSPGYLPDPQGEGTLMPITNRVALTLPAARRLAETLLKALQQPAGDSAGLPDLN